jgi:hypothetical protein
LERAQNRVAVLASGKQLQIRLALDQARDSLKHHWVIVCDDETDGHLDTPHAATPA